MTDRLTAGPPQRALLRLLSVSSPSRLLLLSVSSSSPLRLISVSSPSPLQRGLKKERRFVLLSHLFTASAGLLRQRQTSHMEVLCCGGVAGARRRQCVAVLLISCERVCVCVCVCEVCVCVFGLSQV